MRPRFPAAWPADIPLNPCTASRSSAKCAALTEVVPGMIGASLHDGSIRPQARYAASRAMQGCVMWTALMEVTPDTMIGSVQGTLASPQWRRAASIRLRSSLRWTARTAPPVLRTRSGNGRPLAHNCAPSGARTSTLQSFSRTRRAPGLPPVPLDHCAAPAAS